MRSVIRVERGGPRLFVNDVETYPLLALGTELFPTIGNFTSAGIHLFHPLLGLKSCWTGPGQYDWSLFERYLHALLERDPEAYFLPRLQLNTPNWWKESHPDECIRYGRTPPDRFHDIVSKQGLAEGEGGHHFGLGREVWEASFASERWLDDTEAAVRDLVRHIRSGPLRTRVLGLHPTTGATGEWNYFGPGFIPDYSAPMQAACGPVPERERRIATTHGLLRDPKLEADIIAFYDCFHATSADAVLRFPRAIKEASGGDMLCGVYYGYLLEQVRIQEGGYLASLKVFDDPHVDYIAGPYAYQPGNVTNDDGVAVTMVDGGGNRYGHSRGVGGDGGYRMLVDSVTRRGKMYMVEMDPSSYLDARPHDVIGGAGGLGSDTLEGTLRIIRRDLGQMFVRGVGGWLYDFGPLNQAPDGWYASPPIIAEFRRFAQLGERRTSMRLGSVSEVLVVADDRTFATTQHWEAERPWPQFGIRYSDHFNHWFLNTQSRAIHRMGAPADFLHVADVTAEDASRYKLILMLNVFRMDTSHVMRLKAALAGSDATVMWYYAPGFVGSDGFSQSQMEALTGFRFAQQMTPGPMMVRCTREISELAGAESADLSFGVSVDRSPRFVVTAGAEEALGHWADNSTDLAFAARDYDGFRSMYVGSAPLPAELLRVLARRSGVTLWSSRPDIVYASRDAAMIVATSAGERQLRVPEPLAPVDGRGSRTEFQLELEEGDVEVFVR